MHACISIICMHACICMHGYASMHMLACISLLRSSGLLIALGLFVNAKPRSVKGGTSGAGSAPNPKM